MLHTKIEGKPLRRNPRTRWIDQIRTDIEMRVGNWEEIKKMGSGRIETAGDFSVIVYPYVWKLLKNDDEMSSYLTLCRLQLI